MEVFYSYFDVRARKIMPKISIVHHTYDSLFYLYYLLIITIIKTSVMTIDCILIDSIDESCIKLLVITIIRTDVMLEWQICNLNANTCIEYNKRQAYKIKLGSLKIVKIIII